MDFFSNVPRWHGSVMISRGDKTGQHGNLPEAESSGQRKILDVHGSASPSSPFSVPDYSVPSIEMEVEPRTRRDIIVPPTKIKSHKRRREMKGRAAAHDPGFRPSVRSWEEKQAPCRMLPAICGSPFVVDSASVDGEEAVSK